MWIWIFPTVTSCLLPVEYKFNMIFSNFVCNNSKIYEKYGLLMLVKDLALGLKKEKS